MEVCGLSGDSLSKMSQVSTLIHLLTLLLAACLLRDLVNGENLSFPIPLSLFAVACYLSEAIAYSILVYPDISWLCNMPLWAPHYQKRAKNWRELGNHSREYLRVGQHVWQKSCGMNKVLEQWLAGKSITAAKEYVRYVERKQWNWVWHLLYTKLYV